MNNFSIEEARPEDAEKIIAFLNQVGGETDFLTFGLDGFPISKEEEIIIIKKCLNLSSSLMLIGKIDYQIVSQLFIEVSPQPRLAHIGHLGLSVNKDNWGKSIGSRMLTEAIYWAKKRKLAKLQLQVRTDNISAIHLYTKFNFTIEGKIAHSLKIDHILYDDFLMGLNLI